MLSIVTVLLVAVVAPGGGGEEVDAGEEEEWEQVVSAHVEALVCCARSRAAWLQGALQRTSGPVKWASSLESMLATAPARAARDLTRPAYCIPYPCGS